MVYGYRNHKSANTIRFSRILPVAILVLALILSGGFLGPAPAGAEGTTYTWTGNAGDSYWHTAGNWVVGEEQVPEQAPGSGDTVIISESSVVECVYGATGVTLQCGGDLTVSDGALLSLTGDCALTGGKIHGDGTIEISGSGSKLTWSEGTISEGTGSLVVGAGAEFLIEKTGQAGLNLFVKNEGRLSVSKTVTQVSMQKGYTQTDTGTLSFDFSKDGKGSAVFGHMSVKQETALELAGKLHVNLVDGYRPAGWTTFQVLVYPDSVIRTGQFTEVTSSEISRIFTAKHTNLGVTLTAQEVITAAPTPSLYPGTYGGGAISVALFSYTEGAQIHYTTDGITNPTTGSTLYTGPIAVNANMTIKAFAVSEGLPDSPVVTLDYEIGNDFAGGYGTEENPYEVATAHQLNNVRYYPYDYFIQTANIDLNVDPYNTGDGWLPIGGYDSEKEADDPFCGIFDGQEHTISNLFIHRIAEKEEDEVDVGLFGLVEGAEIRNVRLLDVDVAGDSFVGSLAGYTEDTLIENCSATGEVRGTGYCIGGLVGCSDVYEVYDDCQITGSYSTCIVSGGTDVGGLVGGNSGQIISSYAQGDVTGTWTGETGTCAGGLVGFNYQGIIACSYATGNVTGAGMPIGGLVGYNSGIINCAYAMGKVTGASECGGLVGEKEPEASTTNSYWDKETSGQNSSAGGTGKTTAEMKAQATYAGWDFETIWGIDAGKNKGYPFLRGFTVEEPEDPGNPPADDEPFWRYRSPLPTWRDLTEVKYLNGKFMALGGAGTLIVSTDGANWETVCVDATVTLRGITYGKGLYVAVGYSGSSGKVYASSNGEKWTEAAETQNHQLYDVVYGNNKFVAVGQKQEVVVSSDGITWEVKESPQNSYLSSIIYTGDRYVAVGSGSSSYSKIVVSSNGEDWEAKGSANCDLAEVAYGSGILVAVGTDLTSDSQPRIYTSLDNGVTWTPYYPVQGYKHTRLYTVEHDGSKFIAAGYSYSSDALYKQYVLTSTDGKVWTSGSAQADIRFKALTVGNGTLVGVGDYGDIVSSSDGVTWTKRTLGSNRALDDVASNGSIFVAVGSNGAIQTSDDGITWTSRVSGTTERLGPVESLNGKFIAVGNKGVILTSEDGIDWTTKEIGTGIDLIDVTYGNDLYIIVGRSNHKLVILTSSDGATWSPVSHSHSSVASTITYGNNTFIALGYDQVYRSENGSDWTGTYLSGISPLDITYVDGRFIATGENGEIYISEDKGINWIVNKKVAGVIDQINSVAYGGGNLVAVARYGKILISFDKGDTWTQQESGYSLDLNGVVAGSSNFVAVGSTGLTLQSKDFGTPGNPDADAVAADKAALTWERIKGGNNTPDNVTANLLNPLPTTGTNGTTITWSASPTGWISTTSGKVTRPTSAQGDKTLTLTATISKGSASDTESFTLIIKATAPEQTADEAIALDLAALTWDVIKGSNSSETNVTSNLVLPTRGANGTTISWSVNPAGWVNITTGAVTRPSNSEGNKTVTLTATISKQGGQSRTKEFTLTIMAMASSGTGSGGGDVTIYHTITVTAGTGGTITPKTIKVEANGSQTFTITPDKGYEIEDVLVDGKSIGVKTSYTFKKVTGKHTIAATFKKLEEEAEEVPAPELPFQDVHENDWFYNSIRYAYEKGLMQGTGPESFSPAWETSRGMIVTILHRLEKTPAGLGSIFTDVAEGTWYTEAVSWAAENGIVQGYGSNLFGPDDSITREQLARILYNYARYAGYDVSQSSTLAVFGDGHTTAAWAVEAMEWAVGSGLIQGKDGNILDPAGPATRAEVATILQRFIENNAK